MPVIQNARQKLKIDDILQDDKALYNTIGSEQFRYNEENSIQYQHSEANLINVVSHAALNNVSSHQPNS